LAVIVEVSKLAQSPTARASAGYAGIAFKASISVNLKVDNDRRKQDYLIECYLRSKKESEERKGEVIS